MDGVGSVVEGAWVEVSETVLVGEVLIGKTDWVLVGLTRLNFPLMWHGEKCLRLMIGSGSENQYSGITPTLVLS